MSPKLRAFIDFIWKKRTLYVALGMLIAFAMVFLVLATPLCVYLPGYLDMHKRALVMESAMRIDSLERENDLRLAYLNNMTAILRDQVKTDDLMPYDSTLSLIQDTLLTASEREMLFVSEYEKRERFGVMALDETRPDAVVISFLAPVKGKVSALEESKSVNGMVRIEVSQQVPVMAPLDGTIVSIVQLLSDGSQITMQHTGDYVTIYSHLSSSIVEVGQEVKAGRVIGYAGSRKDVSECWMGLSVWHKGKTVNPLSVMPIE